MSLTNRQILLATRPAGMPISTNFSFVQTEVPTPGEGQILGRTIYLSLDPYMRGRMNEGKSYSPPVGIGEVMIGGTVSEVVDSKHPGFSIGDIVLNENGWQDYAVSDGEGVRKLDPGFGPLSNALGVSGMPGLTAYVGLLDIGKPKAGETVVVSSAAGAVGSVVGQIARIKGCRVVGVAGSPAKCDYVVKELGFDDCINYKSDGFVAQLQNACPDGVDIYFESVGGRVLEGVTGLLNVGARIPLCGMISYYNLRELPPGPDRTPLLMRSLLINRVSLQGFIVFDHFHRQADFLKDMQAWLASGDVVYREDVVDGLENAPEAFKGMLMGKNFGKQVIRVARDPFAG
ncbi:MAG: NADP-dependent oxidoreductase [Gammaproteobacteria bacterium]|nr:NADP-dependent oxidoreductase [Gammaproteobacteria bacterium]